MAGNSNSVSVCVCTIWEEIGTLCKQVCVCTIWEEIGTLCKQSGLRYVIMDSVCIGMDYTLASR